MKDEGGRGNMEVIIIAAAILLALSVILDTSAFVLHRSAFYSSAFILHPSAF